MNIAICVPCRDTVMAGFAFDLAKLCAYDAYTNDAMYMSPTSISPIR